MSILPSHRQGLYYLEHCRVMAKDERVVYARQEGAFTKFFAIPPANTNVILLGSGTSITQAAARLLASEQVMFAFVGGGGSPLFLASQNEYRPTAYCQAWIHLWQDDAKRLAAAKAFQFARVEFLLQQWPKLSDPKPERAELERLGERYLSTIEPVDSSEQILTQEAQFAKGLYRLWANCTKTQNFTRDPGKRDLKDPFNSYLDHGNYLAYGIAGTVLWVLGIPHSLPLIHGTTRRGALVFDVADIIKDTCVMPVAFQYAAAGHHDQDMRQACIAWIDQSDAMSFLFKTVQRVTASP